MNIAIVDDDVDFSSELQQYVKKFIERLYTRYEIDIINNNFFNNTLDKTYDIVFLDIDLKETMQLFTFDFHGRKTNLFLKDIYFIESSGDDVTLYTKNGKYCYRATMKNILDNLGTETIVQFQKSFSVNLDYIKEIEKNTIILKNNEEFNIGRKFKNNVIQKYKEHFLR